MARKDLALEGLRGIAALTVVFGHFAFVFFPFLGTVLKPVAGAEMQPASLFERVMATPPFTLLFSAEAAVCVFFVMSGYVLTTKFFATGAVEHLQAAAAKRYVRLVLPTLASVLFAWVLWSTGAILTAQAGRIGVAGWVPSWYVEPFTFGEAVFNGLISAPLFGKTSLNPPLWTIQVELLGSILLFAVMALFGRGRPILLVGWFLFFANVLGFAAPNILFYLCFLIGALLNLCREQLRRQQAACLLLCLLGVVAFAPMPVQPMALPDLQPYGPDFNLNPRLFWNSLGAMLLVAGVLGSRPMDRLLSARPLVFLGRISFSMYLIHVPLLLSLGLWVSRQAQKSGLGQGAAAALAFLAYLAAVLVLANLFHRWVDAPAIRWAGRIAEGWRAEFRVRRAVAGE